MEKTYEEKILKEVLNACNHYEAFAIKLFRKTFIKVYKIGITDGFNNK